MTTEEVEELRKACDQWARGTYRTDQKEMILTYVRNTLPPPPVPAPMFPEMREWVVGRESTADEEYTYCAPAGLGTEYIRFYHYTLTPAQAKNCATLLKHADRLVPAMLAWWESRKGMKMGHDKPWMGLVTAITEWRKEAGV